MLIERLVAVADGRDLVARFLEKAGHEHARDGIVLRQQDGVRGLRGHRVTAVTVSGSVANIGPPYGCHNP